MVFTFAGRWWTHPDPWIIFGTVDAYMWRPAPRDGWRCSCTSGKKLFAEIERNELRTTAASSRRREIMFLFLLSVAGFLSLFVIVVDLISKTIRFNEKSYWMLWNLRTIQYFEAFSCLAFWEELLAKNRENDGNGASQLSIRTMLAPIRNLPPKWWTDEHQPIISSTNSCNFSKVLGN